MPALPPEKFLQQQKPGRQIRTRLLDGKSYNPVNNYARHNDRPYVVTHCNTEELKNSFFPRTTVDWNRLEDSVVHANSVGSFKPWLLKPVNCALRRLRSAAITPDNWMLQRGAGGRGVRIGYLQYSLRTGLNESSARRCEFESPSCLWPVACLLWESNFTSISYSFG